MIITYCSENDRDLLSHVFSDVSRAPRFVNARDFVGMMDSLEDHDAIISSDLDGGFDLMVAHQLRQTGSLAFLMVLTNSNDAHTRTLMLDSGVDQVIDISKGYEAEALRAYYRAGVRLHNVLANQVVPPNYLFGPNDSFMFNGRKRELYYRSAKVALTAGERIVLETLLKSNEVATKLDIIKKLYDDIYPERRTIENGFSNTVEVFVCKLRSKMDCAMGVKGVAKMFVKSLQGEGYRMNAVIQKPLTQRLKPV